MRRADHAGIERAHDMLDRRRLGPGLADLDADKRLFQRTGNARRIARRKIPGGRRDDLIALDQTFFDADPMTERPARRFDPADRRSLRRRGGLGAKSLVRAADRGPRLARRASAARFRSPARRRARKRSSRRSPRTKARTSGSPATHCRATAPVSAGCAAEARGLGPGIGVLAVGVGDSHGPRRIGEALAQDRKRRRPPLSPARQRRAFACARIVNVRRANKEPAALS